MGVTYGTPSALDALLAAADLDLSPWPAPPTVYVALDPITGTALMPNPTVIPSTLLLEGSPPLKLPSGTAGYVLTSDASGNLTLQAGGGGGAPSGPAGGDLGGTYPNPTVVSVADVATGTLAIANGGTGQAGRQAAMNALAGAVTGGTYLRGNGTNATMAALHVADITALLTASQSFKPTAPTGTSSTSEVMMGLGGTVAFTPSGTGIVKIAVKGVMVAPTAAVGATVGGRYGTGTAPLNGVAVTGTTFDVDSTVRVANVSSTTGVESFLVDRLALSAGTTYWFDLAVASGTGGDTVQPINLSIVIEELLA